MVVGVVPTVVSVDSALEYLLTRLQQWSDRGDLPFCDLGRDRWSRTVAAEHMAPLGSEFWLATGSRLLC